MVIAAVLAVAFVLVVAWLTGLVPALDNAIGLAPVVIVGLVVVTVIVLARTVVPRRNRLVRVAQSPRANMSNLRSSPRSRRPMLSWWANQTTAAPRTPNMKSGQSFIPSTTKTPIQRRASRDAEQ